VSISEVGSVKITVAVADGFAGNAEGIVIEVGEARAGVSKGVEGRQPVTRTTASKQGHRIFFGINHISSL